MRYNDVISGVLPIENIQLNKKEAAIRLGTSKDFENECISMCYERLKKTCINRYAYAKMKVDFPSEGICDFGFSKVKSFDLYKNLKGSKYVYFLAVTIGNDVDRLIKRLSLTSNSEHFITDALCSALVESLCDEVHNIIQQKEKCKPRFSPGYGDLSLEFQKPLLERLNASNELGISLNSALMMSPLKSITSIMGVRL